MKKVWFGVFVLCFFLLAAIIFFGKSIGLGESWMCAIEIALMVGCAVSFGCYAAVESRTDGDLIAGAEDEDGLVFALSTPVEDLVKKDIVIFHVQKERRG